MQIYTLGIVAFPAFYSAISKTINIISLTNNMPLKFYFRRSVRNYRRDNVDRAESRFGSLSKLNKFGIGAITVYLRNLLYQDLLVVGAYCAVRDVETTLK